MPKARLSIYTHHWVSSDDILDRSQYRSTSIHCRWSWAFHAAKRFCQHPATMLMGFVCLDLAKLFNMSIKAAVENCWGMYCLQIRHIPRCHLSTGWQQRLSTVPSSCHWEFVLTARFGSWQDLLRTIRLKRSFPATWYNMYDSQTATLHNVTHSTFLSCDEPHRKLCITSTGTPPVIF